jgi:hypothetical protein
LTDQNLEDFHEKILKQLDSTIAQSLQFLLNPYTEKAFKKKLNGSKSHSPGGRSLLSRNNSKLNMDSFHKQNMPSMKD